MKVILMSKISISKKKRKHVDLKKAVLSLIAKKHSKVKKHHKKIKKIQQKQAMPIGEVEKLKSDVELLKAELSAVKELSKGNTETITFVSEHVGEFKTYMIDLEKSINKAIVQVNKNSMRLDDINPVGARKNIAQQNAKIEEFDGRLDGVRDAQKQIMESMKDLREQVKLLRDVRPLLELNEELNKKAVELQKLVAKVERYASKTEGIYVGLQSHVKDFEMFKKQVGTLQTGHDDVMRNMELLRQRMGDSSKTEEASPKKK
jgi:chromosome segregation ATPase